VAGVNLVTAFIASRVIGAFEGSIEKLVALAALMPIVAGIGGNSGNQTITMIVRAMALGQVQQESARVLLRKEIGVAMVNGLIWGSLLGFVAWWLYRSVPLGAGDDGGDDAEPDRGGHGRRRRAAAAPAPGLRPGDRLQRDDHRRDGQQADAVVEEFLRDSSAGRPAARAGGPPPRLRPARSPCRPCVRCASWRRFRAGSARTGCRCGGCGNIRRRAGRAPCRCPRRDGRGRR
jgi:hypothetical protein